jgi:hypothetical protein
MISNDLILEAMDVDKSNVPDNVSNVSDNVSNVSDNVSNVSDNESNHSVDNSEATKITTNISCSICNFTATTITQFRAHLNRKTPCIPIVSELALYLHLIQRMNATLTPVKIDTKRLTNYMTDIKTLHERLENSNVQESYPMKGKNINEALDEIRKQYISA